MNFSTTRITQYNNSDNNSYSNNNIVCTSKHGVISQDITRISDIFIHFHGSDVCVNHSEAYILILRAMPEIPRIFFMLFLLNHAIR